MASAVAFSPTTLVIFIFSLIHKYWLVSCTCFVILQWNKVHKERMIHAHNYLVCLFLVLLLFIIGTITCLTFHNSTHMLSASEDNTICVWECRTWECLKTLKGHR